MSQINSEPTTSINLTFDESDFLMHCIEMFCSNEKPNFTTHSGEVIFTYEQIEMFWHKIQEAKLQLVN
jgi:hypothetical protein